MRLLLQLFLLSSSTLLIIQPHHCNAATTYPLSRILSLISNTPKNNTKNVLALSSIVVSPGGSSSSSISSSPELLLNNKSNITTKTFHNDSKTSENSSMKDIKLQTHTRNIQQHVNKTRTKLLLPLLSPRNNNDTTTNANTTKHSNESTSKWSSDPKKRFFLDKIEFIGTALLKSDSAILEEEEEEEESSGEDDDESITHQSDLTLPNRHIWIVTTAALPWMTGTAVNPLLRAAYLCRRKLNEIHSSAGGIANDTNEKNHHHHQWVTLIIPWLELEEDRMELYGSDYVFANEMEQEEYIRSWMRETADLSDVSDPESGLRIIFYPARYHSGLKSIFAMGDICGLIPDSEADVCILEEPEHLNWYRAPGSGWTKKFNYVIGIVHTNYKEYASAHYSGLWTAPAIGIMSSAMIRAYCHKVVKLSDVLQTYAPEKEVVANVHGVRSEFLEEGRRRAEAYYRRSKRIAEEGNGSREEEEEEDGQCTRAYFIGKLLWAKGLDRLLELEDFYKQCTGDYFPIDIYGSGPELKEIKRAFHGRTWSLSRLLPEMTHGKSNHSTMGGASQSSILPTEIDDDESSDSDSDSDETFFSDIEDLFQFITSLQNSTKLKIAKLSQTIKSTTDSFEQLDDIMPKSLHELRRKPIPSNFPGRIDHSQLTNQYKVFVNPSQTEVLCTTTAEALAMGKFAIVPLHPSNEFFLKFPNCLAYRNKMEFAANVRWALLHEPEPLTPELAWEFTWEAATERFLDAVGITKREARYRAKLGKCKLDERIAWFHNQLGKGAAGDALRLVLGGGPISHQVKYEMEKKGVVQREEEGGSSEEEEEGMPGKFRGSALAKAIRSTLMIGYVPG